MKTMKNIHFTSHMPTTLKQPYCYSGPYALVIKTFEFDDIVPLHYEETMEILLCDNLVGEISIGENVYPLQGKQVFAIVPNTIHSNRIRACEGTEYVLKVSLERLSRWVNLPDIFQAQGLTLQEIMPLCPDYAGILSAFEELIRNDGDIFLAMMEIIRIFKILSCYRQPAALAPAASSALDHSNLRDVILWTQEHFDERITLDSIAQRMGYSKFYFCSRFKKLTGTTYVHYLNMVRITHAHQLLNGNISVAEACYACGFSDPSYFIQAFKRVYGKTPKQYALSQRQRMQEG